MSTRLRPYRHLDVRPRQHALSGELPAVRPDRRQDRRLRLQAPGRSTRPRRGASRRRMFYKYGTTLRGLMSEHQVEPDDFLDYRARHRPFAGRRRSRRSTRRCTRFPAASSSSPTAPSPMPRRCWRGIGVTHHFGDIFDIVHSDYIPKPAIEPYRKFIAQTGDRARDAPPCSRTSPAISKRRMSSA